MNANELADKLANVGWDKPFTSWELLDEATTMLRQQQEKLTKYELSHAKQRKRIDELDECIRQYAIEFNLRK